MCLLPDLYAPCINWSVTNDCVGVIQIDESEKELKRKLDLDEEKRNRSMEEMAQEADGYRLLFS